jgi:hypothetical protein
MGRMYLCLSLRPSYVIPAVVLGVVRVGKKPFFWHSASGHAWSPITPSFPKLSQSVGRVRHIDLAIEGKDNQGNKVVNPIWLECPLYTDGEGHEKLEDSIPNNSVKLGSGLCRWIETQQISVHDKVIIMGRAPIWSYCVGVSMLAGSGVGAVAYTVPEVQTGWM